VCKEGHSSAVYLFASNVIVLNDRDSSTV
jgi:hypothetical protein